MSISIECHKLKRTALLPTVFAGGIIAALIPLLGTIINKSLVNSTDGMPLTFLIRSNWLMMAMLNMLILTLGASILYYIEFADNAIQKMESLPIHLNSIYRSKTVILLLLYIIVLVLEGVSFGICGMKWLNVSGRFWKDLIVFMAYALLLSLPILSLLVTVSSASKNMWITVGVGAIGIFSGSLNLGGTNSVLGYLPFTLLNQPAIGAGIIPNIKLCVIAICQTILFLAIGIVLPKLRRKSV